MPESDTNTVAQLRTDVARERVTRHLVEGGVDPEYAEFHVAKHGEFQTADTGVKVRTPQGWAAAGDEQLKAYAGELLKTVPAKFRGEELSNSLSGDYDAAAAGKAMGQKQRKAIDDQSLAFR